MRHYLLSFLFLMFSATLQATHHCTGDHDCDLDRQGITPSKYGSTGKWADDVTPKQDWACDEVEDLGSPSLTCEMCEKETIRYVHKMSHLNYPDILEVGCICAGHMEGDLDAAKERDKKLHNIGNRRKNWTGLKGWGVSKKGNPYLNHNGHHVVISKSRFGKYSPAINNKFSNQWFSTPEEAKIAAFDILYPKKITFHNKTH